MPYTIVEIVAKISFASECVAAADASDHGTPEIVDLYTQAKAAIDDAQSAALMTSMQVRRRPELYTEEERATIISQDLIIIDMQKDIGYKIKFERHLLTCVHMARKYAESHESHYKDNFIHVFSDLLHWFASSHHEFAIWCKYYQMCDPRTDRVKYEITESGDMMKLKELNKLLYFCTPEEFTYNRAYMYFMYEVARKFCV